MENIKELDRAKKLFSDRLSVLIQSQGVQQNILADKIGVSESTVGKWLLEKALPRMGAIQKLSDYFNVPKSYFLEENYEGNTPAAASHRHGVKIPVLGYVAAGQPIYASEHWIDEEEIPESMAKTGDYFGLIIHGESMEPEIYDGDIVIVRKQETCKNRQIAIVLINGDDATCKIVHLQQDGILLEGRNYKVYTPTFYNNEAIEKLPVQIIGVVAEVRRKYPI